MWYGELLRVTYSIDDYHMRFKGLLLEILVKNETVEIVKTKM